MDNIIIFSRNDDIHAYALKKIAKDLDGPSVEILDTSFFPENEFCVKWYGETLVINFYSQNQIEISSSTAVWWRRPQNFIPSLEITEPKMRRFVVSECSMTLEGGLTACDCFLVNNIFNERRASNKILQLETARRIGFQIPETYITNSLSDVRELYSKFDGQIIFKGLTDAKYHLGETRQVTSEILEKDDKLKYAPVQFQWKVPCKYDLRVTVVGDDVFATKIHSGNRGDLIDWRVDLKIPMEPYHLPNKVKFKCLKLARKLGLLYGAIDLRETPQGEIYFFEINPSGQFLFCDQVPDLPITYALYELLSKGMDHYKFSKKISSEEDE